MGITIWYEGSLDDPGKLDDVIAEMQDISREFGWPCETVTERISGSMLRLLLIGGADAPEKAPRPVLLEDEMRGVSMQPPGTDTFTITFDKAGKIGRYMAAAHNILLDQPSPEYYSPDETYYIPLPLWVKTTGALDQHVLIVMALERLQRKFIGNLKIKDDSDFAETKDFSKLRESHGIMAAFAATFSDPEAFRSLMKMAGDPLPDDATIELLPRDLRARTTPRARAQKAPN